MENRAGTRWFLFCGLILLGTISYFMTKLQNMTYVDEFETCDPILPGKTFNHPYVQTCMMFLAELFCLLLYAIYKRRYRREFQMKQDYARLTNRSSPKFYFYMLPALFDFLSAVCMYTALNFISGSTFQLIRSLSVVTTGLFAYLFTKVKFQRNQYIGSGLAVAALLLTSLTQYLLEKNTSTEERRAGWEVLIGIGLMTVAVCFEGIFFASEQRLFQKFHIEPLKLVGMEGLLGSIMAITAILITSAIKVPNFKPWNSVCVNGEQYYEGGLTALKEIVGSSLLTFYCVMMMASLCAFNIFGVYVTKLVNAQGRCLMTASRALLIWVIGIIIAATGKEGFESLNGLIIVLKILSLGLLFVAVMLYTELICVNKQKKR